MSKNNQITDSLVYLLDTWYNEGELSPFDYKNYSIVAERGTLKQKKSLWYDLVGSPFEFE